MLGGLGVGTDQQTYASDFASTRSPQLHPENLSNDVSKIPAGQDVKVRATNVGGQTILGNLTITQPDGAGYSTAYPCAEGLPVPLTSSINFAAGQTIANGVIVKSDINGDICFRGNTALHMIWDQTGETSTIATHSPVRKKDTRDNGGALLTANRALKIHASDKGSETILANLAITQPNAAGFATVYACNEGLPNPLTSSINFAAGQTIANFVIAKADSSGDVCIASNVATHIIWDQTGETNVVATHNPVRKKDTRDTNGAKVMANGDVRIHATDIGSQTIIGNLAITQPEAGGFATAYPCAEGIPVPLTSNINFVAGQTVANNVIVKADVNGDICFRPNVATHLIWDQTGET
ncbi:hypothetical protein EB118_24995, partial [bacterium]|nr:hypothetical protein [bacterium]